MENEEDRDTGLGRFIEELAASSTSPTASQMKAELLALAKVRSVLRELEVGRIRVLEGHGLLESYKTAVGEQELGLVEVDFILRKDNVELQLEVKTYPKEGIYLTRQDLEQLRQVLAQSAKTQEVLVVWVDGQLPTMALSLSVIERLLLSIKGDRQSIQEELLQPLSEAIEAAFERHAPVWIRPADISVAKGPRYDVRDLFIRALNDRIENLKQTGDTRRHPDRRQAIQSITDSDIAQLSAIFDESLQRELTLEEIESRLGRLSY